MTTQDAQLLINNTISAIKPIDGKAMEGAARRMDGLLKPPGSLGRLEELAVRLAGIQGVEQPVSDSSLCLVYAADHGVVTEAVSTAPQSVSSATAKPG